MHTSSPFIPQPQPGDRLEVHQLARDGVPGKMTANGQQVDCVQLNPDEFRDRVRHEFLGAAHAVFFSDKANGMNKAIARLEEALALLMETQGVNPEEIAKLRKKLVEESGDFSQRIFLKSFTTPVPHPVC